MDYLIALHFISFHFIAILLFLFCFVFFIYPNNNFPRDLSSFLGEVAMAKNGYASTVDLLKA
jgi:hypothetical protein